MRSDHRSAVTAVVALVPVLLGACQAAPSPARTTTVGITTTAPADATASGSALAAAQSLTVKGRAPMTGYSRDRFGLAWTDDNGAPWGHNGCDTRNDILRRDLTNARVRNGCTVYSGVLDDPYTGRRIAFTRGFDTSVAVQIDHVVALGDAWQTGAQRLDATTRTRLANDPLELLAVDGPTNQAKGDADAASWLPPNRAFRCTYVAHQVAVKAAYALWVTPAERDAMRQVLERCPSTPAPRSTLAR
jgi:hypothetical protein